jgi:late competence protein required for DNA uptake (superfamily II DNA/RNA helicase)
MGYDDWLNLLEKIEIPYNIKYNRMDEKMIKTSYINFMENTTITNRKYKCERCKKEKELKEYLWNNVFGKFCKQCVNNKDISSANNEIFLTSLLYQSLQLT